MDFMVYFSPWGKLVLGSINDVFKLIMPLLLEVEEVFFDSFHSHGIHGLKYHSNGCCRMGLSCNFLLEVAVDEPLIACPEFLSLGISSSMIQFNWKKGFFVSLLHSGCETFVSLLACSFDSLVSQCRASGVTCIMGSTATGVVGGHDSGDEYPPDPGCTGVVRLGDKFPSLILEMDCWEDMLCRIGF